MRSNSSAGKPGPRSEISKIKWFPSMRPLISMRVFGGVWVAAFASKLVSTCSISTKSIFTCLLDELDAPLDESNIGRFTDLLRKFVKDSQFIIITHNKRTVAAANAIYGVTMEERGVSKTVSMRFNHERGEAEAHHPATVADSVRSAVTLPAAPVASPA